jgi:hypothetical protein
MRKHLFCIFISKVAIDKIIKKLYNGLFEIVITRIKTLITLLLLIWKHEYIAVVMLKTLKVPVDPVISISVANAI